MKVVVRARANRDLDDIFEWIVKDNRRAATEMVRRIRDRIDLLADSELPDMGRIGRVAGTRELVEGPYIIVSEPRHERDETAGLTIVHAARRR